ncbi:ABC transporter permease [Jiangella sp. DSM 45060]|uniref:ABC transporter permease n=1 Tax=Jiangella sp. DSM 45060 TaxID=1798224 RepID=UPI000879FFCA|nr:ABC transporter permease [Jiangella sp. DSM 45060]SDS55999.1 peptide/nickel transport system permease protein [Jiangella sp. DSM 45060]
MTAAPVLVARSARAGSQPVGVWASLLRHPSGRAGLAIAALLALVALVGPWLTADPNQTSYDTQLAPPSSEHLLGTDQAGRDQLARVVAGAQTTLGAALAVFVLVGVIGVVVGMVAALAGGWVDTVISRIVDLLLGLPSLVLALAIVGTLGPSLRNVIIALTVSGWAYLARLARSHALGAHDRPDVVAARMAGVGRVRIAVGHVLPGVTVQVAIAATMELSAIILGLSALSFLGLGVQPPTAEWGQMLAESRFALTQMPTLALGPGLAVMLAVGAAVLISEALRDVVDPAWRRG